MPLSWSVPIDPQFATYGRLPVPLLGLLTVLVGLFVVEWRRGRLQCASATAAKLLAALLGSLACVTALWLILAAGSPAWDATVTQALTSLRFLRPLAVLAAFPFSLAALFALFVWCIKRGRWKEAYFALAAGPGLAAVVITLKLAYPRSPLGAQPFFGGPTAFVDDAAALWSAALLLLLLLVPRLTGRKVSRVLVGVLALLAVAPLLAGVTRSSDALVGGFLALGWVSACRMALHLADSKPGSIVHAAADRLDAWMQRIVTRPAPWLVGLITFGVALRILSYWTSPLAVDTYSYAVLGRSILEHGNLTMPWGDVDTFYTSPVPSHHYPPLYPLYLAGFYEAFGFTQSATRIAAIASSLAALGVTYLCTTNLYGKGRGQLAAAIVAVSPLLVQNTGQGYSENLVLLLFVATLWAILKSLDKPWFIVLAGIMAGLGYLAKSSMGYFFIIAGLGGLAWRLRWRGLAVLRDPSYLTAIAAFIVLITGWAVRNFLLFGTWETSAHISEAYRTALSHPAQWGFLALVTFVFYATAGYLLLLALLPWLPRLGRIPRLDSEHDSGLWLALGLPLLLSSLIDAALWLVEGEFFLNNARYIAFVMVPAIWLIARHADPAQRTVRLAALVTMVILVAGSLYFARPTGSFTQQMADDLAPRLDVGDSVGFVDNNNHYAYRFYFQLTDGGRHDRTVQIACLEHPLCPPDALRANAINTTWLFAPDYAAGQVMDRYHKVPGAVANSDGVHRDSPQLWRHD